MHKFTKIGSLTQALAYVRATLADPDCPERYKVRTPVRYRGTVKLHGSNCGVACTPTTLVPQSRETVLGLGPERSDYCGFAAFVASAPVTVAIRELEAEIRAARAVDPTHELYLYGEWCGRGIMKGAAINALPTKQWVLFGVRVVGEGDSPRDEYLDALGAFSDRFAHLGVHSIFDGPTWELEVDFASDDDAQRALEQATEWVSAVEAECPWAARFGVKGLGEGIVWTPLGDHWGRTDLYFKVKGAKHRKVKSKRETPQVSPEVLAGIEAFVEFAAPETRLEQGVEVLRERGLPLKAGSLGPFLKWVGQDVKAECVVELQANGLEWKQVSKAVATRARLWFLARVEASRPS